jgi:hypothetical protein
MFFIEILFPHMRQATLEGSSPKGSLNKVKVVLMLSTSLMDYSLVLANVFLRNSLAAHRTWSFRRIISRVVKFKGMKAWMLRVMVSAEVIMSYFLSTSQASYDFYHLM